MDVSARNIILVISHENDYCWSISWETLSLPDKSIEYTLSQTINFFYTFCEEDESTFRVNLIFVFVSKFLKPHLCPFSLLWCLLVKDGHLEWFLKIGVQETRMSLEDESLMFSCMTDSQSETYALDVFSRSMLRMLRPCGLSLTDRFELNSRMRREWVNEKMTEGNVDDT